MPPITIQIHLDKTAQARPDETTLFPNYPNRFNPEMMYQSRSRAAYWDGKNEFGESVASGLYFYTLTAGDFTATRKMLIQTYK